MRLRVGIVLVAVTLLFVLVALPSPWYHVHVVGRDFEAAVTLPMDPEEQEVREINGKWTLWEYEVSDEAFDVPPQEYDDPYFVSPYEEEPQAENPNAHVLEVYGNTAVLVSSAALAVAAAALGSWNIARHGRWRMFTAASWVLAAVLLIGACHYFGSELPGALAQDAATGHDDAYGRYFEPYINTEGEQPAFYSDFSGGYPNQDPRAAEQLQYGPSSGWWLSGAAGVMCIIVAAVLYGAPQWSARRRRAPDEGTIRYVPVPVPVVTRGEPRRYPRRMHDPNLMSPGARDIAQVRPGMRYYKR